MGCVLTIVFVVAAFSGSTAAGWFGVGALSEAVGRGSSDTSLLLAVSIAGAGAGAEMLKLVLAVTIETIGRRSIFQGALAGLLWGLCLVCCIGMPLLIISELPSWRSNHAVLFQLIAGAWLFIQVGSAILPALSWPRRPEVTKTQSNRSAMPSAPNAREVTAVCADELHLVLLRLAAHAPGTEFAGGGRIGAAREIVISQGQLGRLIGRSKATTNRWLHQLSKEERIAVATDGRETCISVTSVRPPSC
jgi:hypothetical protein